MHVSTTQHLLQFAFLLCDDAAAIPSHIIRCYTLWRQNLKFECVKLRFVESAVFVRTALDVIVLANEIVSSSINFLLHRKTMGQTASQFVHQLEESSDEYEVEADIEDASVAHQILIDPRSPSRDINRTPIQVKGCSVNSLKERIRNANKFSDPLSSVNEAASKAVDCEQYRYIFVRGSHLAKKYVNWIEKLPYNSRHYDSATAEHCRQLHNLSSRVIVVKTLDDQPVAYCRFHFVVDNDFAVLHLYEIYVEKSSRRKHIGSKLLSIVSMIAERTNMDKVIVKLPPANAGILSFFSKNNFFVEALPDGGEYSSSILENDVRGNSIRTLLRISDIVYSSDRAVYCTHIADSIDDSHPRNKRQFYYDGYYGAYAGYTAYRVIGIIIGIVLLCICCFLPCICVAGIWFAGWFGIRNREKRSREQNSETPPRVVIQNTAPSSFIPSRESYDTQEHNRDGRSDEMFYQVRESDRYFDSDNIGRKYDRYERRKTSRL
uniref:N-alpha-acetyltransferase 40 n=1 Tax=Syphacia muris TaxID=451379 RepID=A0A0N5AWG9_9BILA